MANYIVLGTWNTKREELDFLCEEIRRRSHRPIPLDLSTKKANVTRNIAVSQSISRARARLKEIAKKIISQVSFQWVGVQIFSWRRD